MDGFTKRFGCRIRYYLGKKNIMADTLNKKSTRVLAHLMVSEWELRGAMQ